MLEAPVSQRIIYYIKQHLVLFRTQPWHDLLYC